MINLDKRYQLASVEGRADTAHCFTSEHSLGHVFLHVVPHGVCRISRRRTAGGRSDRYAHYQVLTCLHIVTGTVLLSQTDKWMMRRQATLRELPYKHERHV